jgi:hypothetical protein
MSIDFLRLEKAANGDWMVEFSSENRYPDFKWITDFEAQLILSAQRAARNDLRSSLKGLMVTE